MNFPLQTLWILTIWSNIFLYFSFLSRHHAWTIFAAFSLYLGFIILCPRPVAFTFFILNFSFLPNFSWAKSTTPPLSILIRLKIVLSSAFNPLLLSIAKETYKNFGFLLSVFFFPPTTVVFNVCLSNVLSPKLLFNAISVSFKVFLFFDNKILLSLFIFCKTLYLSLNILSFADCKTVWELLIRFPSVSLLGS